MNKPGEDHDLTQLKGYVNFLNNEKFVEASKKYLKLLQEEEVPLLKVFAHLTPKELLNRTKFSLKTFLEELLDDRLFQNTVLKIDRWKVDDLPDIPRDRLEMRDILKINSVKKQLLIYFLPEYTAHNNTTALILMRLEKMFLRVESKMLEAFTQFQQKALSEKNQFISQLIQNSVNGVWATNAEMQILEWNPILERKFALSKKDVVGKNLFQVFPEYKNSLEGEAILEVFKGKKVELLNRRFNASGGWYDAFIIPLTEQNGAIKGAFSIIHEITVRKEVELKLQEHREELQTANEELREHREELQAANEELRESYQQLIKVQADLQENEARLLEAQASAHLGSWEYNIENNEIYWSEEMKRIFGYNSQENPDYESYINMVHPEDREKVNRHVSQAINAFEPYSFEHRILKRDGSTRWLVAKGYAVVSTGSKHVKLRGTGLDVTELKLAELKDLENKHFIQKVADTTPDIITVYDLKENKNIYSNKELFEVLNYSAEEIEQFRKMGKRILAQLIHPDDLQGTIDLLGSFKEYKGRATKEVEYRIKHKNGSWIWMLGRYNVFKKDPNGFPSQIIGISRDISSRKAAEHKIQENEKRLKDSQALANLGSWEFNSQLKSIYWSEELYNIFQIPLNTPMTLDKYLAFILPEDRQKMQEKIQSSMDQGEAYTSIYRVTRMDGETRYLLSKGEAVRDHHGNIKGLRGVTQDITERRVVEQKLQIAYEKLSETHNELKQSEEALRELNNELEQRVAQRTKELLESNERLIKKNADLDNFIYTASHDLKVPIANIEGLLHILRNKVNDKLKENDKILLNMMNDSVERFNATIKDLTQISKIQKDLEEESSEKVLISSVLEELTKDIADLVAEKNAKLNTNFELEEIHFTKKNLRSVLYNLIMNSLKYSSAERMPEITIGTSKTEEGVELYITDNGLGIPENQKNKIFSLFKRYHTDVDGSGIGLYIVKRIIENNGGKIDVESEVGKGTTFKLLFSNKENASEIQ